MYYIEEIDVLKFLHAVSQSFPSFFPLLSGGTMATCKGCCHLMGAMLNLAAEAADRAQIGVALPPTWAVQLRRPRALSGEPVQ
jgi:hypothetical protein